MPGGRLTSGKYPGLDGVETTRGSKIGCWVRVEAREAMAPLARELGVPGHNWRSRGASRTRNVSTITGATAKTGACENMKALDVVGPLTPER